MQEAQQAAVGEQEARRFSGAHASTSAGAGSAQGALVPVGPATTPATAPAARAAASGVKRFVRQQIPDEILHDAALNEAIKALPANYNFEIHKTVWRLKQAGSKAPALQFPEGLLMYAAIIADILERFAGADHVAIMGDVTYGACCIDDFSAAAMGADFLVHYGHSCLVPVDVTSMPTLYVFVDIAIDIDHLIGSVELTFPAGTQLVLAGTIQFSSAVQLARTRLAETYPSLAVPKCKPLSPGEVLGCTAPVLTQPADAIVFLADGRFHLEAIMIANPSIPAYRYDPYSRLLTREHYDQEGMRAVRRKAVEAARGAQHWGVVLGTLGRQGNPRLLDTMKETLQSQGKAVTMFLVSELSPQRLALVRGIDAWVQVACPRLSIDWGEAFSQPTLTPYEAMVTLGVVPPWWEQGQQSQQDQAAGSAQGRQQQQASCSASSAAGCGAEGCGAASCGSGSCGGASTKPVDPYPMDYYAQEGGPWNSSYHKKPPGGARARAAAAAPAAAAPAAVVA